MKIRQTDGKPEGGGKIVTPEEEKEPMPIHSKGEGIATGSGSSLTRHSK